MRAFAATLCLVAASTAMPALAQTSRAGLPDFRSIVQRHGPAVVNIRTIQTFRLSIDGPAGADSAGAQNRRDAGAPAGSRVVRGVGSGFIISPEGIILTNAHVVANSAEVIVSMTDGREFSGQVVGADALSDVAVVRIAGGTMPTVPIGKPADAEPGDWVVAIGAPFGFENSVTAGIVSAKGRSLPNGSGVPFIQTDVPINPGNSGGPLFNLDGEVIGINSQIYSNSGAFQGMSFAIPIDVAMRIGNQLVSRGHVVRGHLGVTTQDLTPALAKALGMERARGALINEVEPGSPAQRAGLRAGDVIVAIDGAPVVYNFDLPQHLAAIAPGARAEVGLVRDGKPLQLAAVLDAMPTAADELVGAEGIGPGLIARPLNALERSRVGAAGLLVLEAGGDAIKAGFEAGDVILSINRRPVSDPREFREALRTGSPAAVLVLREDGRRFLALDAGRR
jgi:serine protease Do